MLAYASLMAGAQNFGVCAFLGKFCSHLAPSESSQDRSQPDHICVHHHRCSCYIMTSYGIVFCYVRCSRERKDVCSMLRSKHDWLFHFISQHIWNKQQKKNERNSRENICHDHIITEALPIRSPIANQYRSKRPAYNTRSTRNSEQKCRLYYSEQQANLGCFKPYLDTRILWYHDHLPT